AARIRAFSRSRWSDGRRKLLEVASVKRSLLLSVRNMGETLAISVPTVVDAARNRLTREVCDDRLRGWAKRVMDHLSMTVEVSGAEHFDAAQTYLVMSNRQSHYDVPVLFYV